MHDSGADINIRLGMLLVFLIGEMGQLAIAALIICQAYTLDKKGKKQNKKKNIKSWRDAALLRIAKCRSVFQMQSVIVYPCNFMIQSDYNLHIYIGIAEP